MFMVLYIDAAFQGYGVAGTAHKRPVWPYPTKSAVAGMALAAMGEDRDRSDAALARFNTLSMTTLAVREGACLWDYQTIGGGYDKNKQPGYCVKKADGSIREHAVLVRKEYSVGAKNVVILSGDAEFLNIMAKAFADPVWPVVAGRRNCLLSSPPCVGVFPSSKEAYKKVVELYEVASEKDAHMTMVKEVKEAPPSDGGAFMIVDVRSTMSANSFAARYVVEEAVTIDDIKAMSG